MPNVRPIVKVTSKLSKTQWNRLLERVASREVQGEAEMSRATALGSSLDPAARPNILGGGDPLSSMAEVARRNPGAPLPQRPPIDLQALAEGRGTLRVNDIMSVRPPEGEVYGRLRSLSGEGPKVLDLPFDQAVERYKGGGFEADVSDIPPVDILDVPSGTYKRRFYKSVAPKSEARVEEPKVKKVVQPKVSQAVERSVEKARVRLEDTPADELISQAMVLERMWKFVGGGRSLVGRAWSGYKQSARSQFKGMSPDEYFRHIGLQWMQNPEKAAKLYKREVNSLSRIWEEFMSTMGPQEGGM